MCHTLSMDCVTKLMHDMFIQCIVSLLFLSWVHMTAAGPCTFTAV